jgi:hypothetical protein
MFWRFCTIFYGHSAIYCVFFHPVGLFLVFFLYIFIGSLVSGIQNLGQIILPTTTITSLNASGGGVNGSHHQLAASSGANVPGLLRSKSDHRLAAQFRENEEMMLAGKQSLGGGGGDGKRRYGDAGDHESRSGVRSRYIRVIYNSFTPLILQPPTVLINEHVIHKNNTSN